MRSVVRQMPTALLRLVEWPRAPFGGAELPPAIARIASANGLGSNLSHLVTDSADYALDGVDALLAPDAGPQSAPAIMHALARGKPVVAVRSPNVQELVRHGVTGLLAREGESRAFAAAVVGVLSDHRARRAMSQAARRDAVQRFDLGRATDRTIESYLAMLDLASERAPWAASSI
jgi:glycosyltransferase involved in cell wall biosynthesis